MFKTKVIKIDVSGDKDIMITLKKGNFWSRGRGSIRVTLLSLKHWSLYEYEERVRGDYPLLYELFSNFDTREAESFIKRYLLVIKRKGEL